MGSCPSRNTTAIILSYLSTSSCSKIKRIHLRDVVLDSDGIHEVYVSQADSFTSLTSVELERCTIRVAELRKMLEANQSSIEVLRLRWINWLSQQNDRGVLEDCLDISLRNLRVFDVQGALAFSDRPAAALIGLLGECAHLQDFHVRSIPLLDGETWISVLHHLTQKMDFNTFLNMQKISFGGPACNTEFWDSVAVILALCGDSLESVMINGYMQGPPSPFPESLASFFEKEGIMRQENLKNLTIVWRDGMGVGTDTIAALGIMHLRSSDCMFALHILSRMQRGNYQVHFEPSRDSTACI